MKRPRKRYERQGILVEEAALLRTIGFASSPGLLRVFGFLPAVGTIINFVVGVWMLSAMVVAVRQALDYKGTGRAIGVCLIGWLVYFLVGIFAVLILAGVGIVAGPAAG